MSMHVHELHAAVVHAPLALLPTAAVIDLGSALAGDRAQGRLGRALWWAGAGSGLFAGLAGMAASQEVQTDDKGSEMMWLHGMGNLLVVGTAIGMAIYRSRNRPSVGSAALGLAACGVSIFTAYLGGEMVYGRGVGVRAMPRYMHNGVGESPKLLSRPALPRFFRDALSGLGWLLGRAGRTVRGKERLSKEAFGLGETPTARGVPAL